MLANPDCSWRLCRGNGNPLRAALSYDGYMFASCRDCYVLRARDGGRRPEKKVFFLTSFLGHRGHSAGMRPNFFLAHRKDLFMSVLRIISFVLRI